MKLYSVQDVKGYIDMMNAFKQGKDYVFTLENKICDEDFLSAYKWLRGKMIKKLSLLKLPDEGWLPIWFWKDFGGNKYDASELCKGNILLEVDIPDKYVLLSDFDAWHYVLNHFYLPSSLDEKTFLKEDDKIDKMNEACKENAIINSWDRIFDISKRSGEMGTFGVFIQATVPFLKETWIKNVTFPKVTNNEDYLEED